MILPLVNNPKLRPITGRLAHTEPPPNGSPEGEPPPNGAPQEPEPKKD